MNKDKFSKRNIPMMDIDHYVGLMDYFLTILQRCRDEGIIVLEEYIKDLEKQINFYAFDPIYVGFRSVCQGYDFEIIEELFNNYRKHTLDVTSFNIIARSCLSIQRGDNPRMVILYFASLIPEELRKSEQFINLAKKYDYNLKYKLWSDWKRERELEQKVIENSYNNISRIQE
jgi:flagellar motor component MotA